MSEYFNKVLTVCKNCKKTITIQATYAERNNKFVCESCKIKESLSIQREAQQALKEEEK